MCFVVLTHAAAGVGRAAPAPRLAHRHPQRRGVTAIRSSLTVSAAITARAIFLSHSSLTPPLFAVQPLRRMPRHNVTIYARYISRNRFRPPAIHVPVLSHFCLQPQSCCVHPSPLAPSTVRFPRRLPPSASRHVASPPANARRRFASLLCSCGPAASFIAFVSTSPSALLQHGLQTPPLLRRCFPPYLRSFSTAPPSPPFSSTACLHLCAPAAS